MKPFSLELWDVLREMAPFLLFGFLIAGVLSVLVGQDFVQRHLGRRGLWSAFKAALWGVPLPLCSCGVIPVAASIRKNGASRAATVSFLASTPQTGVDSILVTYSLLGPIFAIFRPVAALFSGLLAGGLVSFGESTDQEVRSVSHQCGDQCDLHRSGNRLYRILHYGFVVLPRDIGKSMLVGLLTAAAISILVPEDFFLNTFGSGLLMMIVMMSLGIPIYVCATASVPVAAALVLKGVTPGAALVFLMTGPATNAATVSTVWKTMGRRTAVLYLLSVGLSALASGLVLDTLFPLDATTVSAGTQAMLPDAIKTISAVLLMVLLLFALRKPQGEASQSTEDHGASHGLRIRVKGMTCSHCVESVHRSLRQLPGVEGVQVDLSSGIVEVRGEGLDVTLVRQAIEEVGYDTEDG